MPKTTVLCIGDSITEGYGIDDWDEIYPKQLNYILGSEYDVNPCLGRCGAAVWSKSALPYASTPQYNKAKSLHADYLVVCLGSNDTVYQTTDVFNQEFKEDYGKLLAGLMAYSADAKLYICKIPPIFGKKNESYAKVVPEINRLIEEVADSFGAVLIDLNTPFTSREDLFSDGIHPNEIGANLIAETVFNALKHYSNE